MKLHIFNPEHDIALAYNSILFTPPHAGRELRSDLGFIPALWADDGDFVLVDDVEAALERVRHIRSLAHDVVFVSKNDIPALVADAPDTLKIDPWGWDKALCHNLQRYGIPSEMLPANETLDDIRTMSGRGWANKLRSQMAIYKKGVIAIPREHTSVDDFLQSYSSYYHHRAVVKSPWSSSGRGVRYFSGELRKQELGWLKNVIQQQGSVVSEVYYNKVKDFAVEFYAHADGSVEYAGLSLFKTINGAYTGNVIASETEKWQMLGDNSVANVLRETIDELIVILQPYMKGVYCGPFGIDMMLLPERILHPCVELNLRRTMGHVALAITPEKSAPQRLMRIDYTNRYHLRVIDTFENIINNYLIPHL